MKEEKVPSGPAGLRGAPRRILPRGMFRLGDQLPTCPKGHSTLFYRNCPVCRAAVPSLEERRAMIAEIAEEVQGMKVNIKVRIRK